MKHLSKWERLFAVHEFLGWASSTLVSTIFFSFFLYCELYIMQYMVLVICYSVYLFLKVKK